MDIIIILTFLILSIIYMMRLYKIKFKDEKRKEIKYLQLVIFSICIIAALTGLWDLFIIAFILIVILFLFPRKFYK